MLARTCVALAVIGCGSKAPIGAASNDDMSKRVVEAIKAKSAPTLIRLASTLEVVERLCPENIERDGRDETARRINDRKRLYGDAIAECWKLADLTNAAIVKSEEITSRVLDNCKDNPTLGASAI